LLFTEKNIEGIVLSYILKKKENFQELIDYLNQDFFYNEYSKKLFSIFEEEKDFNLESLKESIPVKILTYIEKIDLSDVTYTELLNFMFERHRKKIFKERIKKLDYSNRSIQELSFLKEELENLSSEQSISNKDIILEKYKNYIEKKKEQFQNNYGRVGISTGISKLDDKIFGLKDYDFIILAARPSMGKTSLATQFFIQSIFDEKEEGVSVFFSIEMGAEQIIARMLAQTDLNLNLRQTMFGEPVEAGNIDKILEVFKEKDFYIEDFTTDLGQKISITPDDLNKKLKTIEKKHGKIKNIFIDYLQQLSPTDSRIFNQRDKISSISNELKALGRKYGCPVIALSQLNRELEKRLDKRPILSDLRDSGSIEQDADIILFVYRPGVYLERELKDKLKSGIDQDMARRELEILENQVFTKAEIIVGKQRNGPVGTVDVVFYKENALFKEQEEIEFFND
jgi:replicative DNA helicase